MAARRTRPQRRNLVKEVVDLISSDEDKDEVIVVPPSTRFKEVVDLTLSSDKDEVVLDSSSTTSAASTSFSRNIQLIVALTVQTTSLRASDLRILQRKRSWLRSYSPAVPSRVPLDLFASALAATLVFAQEAAGTAVCVHRGGLVLTCAHCVAETPTELARAKKRGCWLLRSDGSAVRAVCVSWDPKRDLAALRIVAAEGTAGGESDATAPVQFPFLEIAPAAPKRGARLLCIGHPGAEDLEAVVPGAKTGYDTLYASTGCFRGLAPGQDPRDNSEIGALMHDCWTYWGHSGAPLVSVQEPSGRLVGLHSSWDDETGMRRGVGWEAVREFLDEVLAQVEM
ncbi:AT hook domain-containing protein [Mycena leptocephala]|nr:AT hook domain-containing protein [Mycena leptocephala]